MYVFIYIYIYIYVYIFEIFLYSSSSYAAFSFVLRYSYKTWVQNPSLFIVTKTPAPYMTFHVPAGCVSVFLF
jgi:hypothetical protein